MSYREDEQSMNEAVDRYFQKMSIDGDRDQKVVERCTRAQENQAIWKWIHRLFVKL